MLFFERQRIIPLVPRKSSKVMYMKSVPRSDTGRHVENTKAIEIPIYKELGKLAGVTSG